MKGDCAPSARMGKILRSSHQWEEEHLEHQRSNGPELPLGVDEQEIAAMDWAMWYPREFLPSM